VRGKGGIDASYLSNAEAMVEEGAVRWLIGSVGSGTLLERLERLGVVPSILVRAATEKPSLPPSQHLNRAVF
jgi:hypothetical protein